MNSTWHCRIGFSLPIDFCIWVLETDGLHVPPFAQHPQHIGPLQQQGLRLAMWQQWFENVIAQQVRFYQPGPDIHKRLLYASDDPTTQWKEPLQLRESLVSLWKDYLQTNASTRKQQSTEQRIATDPDVAKIWGDLKPYHHHIGTLDVWLVSYVVPIVSTWFDQYHLYGLQVSNI